MALRKKIIKKEEPKTEEPKGEVKKEETKKPKAEAAKQSEEGLAKPKATKFVQPGTNNQKRKVIE